MLSAEARRNARIKKILENSEQRLLRITGVENKKRVSELDGIQMIIKNKYFINIISYFRFEVII